MNLEAPYYDIVYEKELYHLKINNQELKTPAGKLIQHHNKKLFEHLIYEIEGFEELDPSTLSIYSLLCTLNDFVLPDPEEYISKDFFQQMIMHDYTLKSNAGPEVLEQYKRWKILMERLEFLDMNHPNLPQTIIAESYDQWISQLYQKEKFQELVDFFYADYKLLSPEQKTVARTAVNIHRSIIYGILLAQGHCDSSEYAVAILAANGLIPSVWDLSTKEDYKDNFYSLRSDASLMNNFLKIVTLPSQSIENKLRAEIPNWNSLPLSAKYAILESSKKINESNSSDYSSYVMLLGKSVEICLKELVFDKYQKIFSIKFSEEKDVKIFIESNKKIERLAKYLIKEPHFIELGTMITILEKSDGKTAKKNEVLKEFFDFISNSLKYDAIVKHEFIEAAWKISKERNKAAHSEIFSYNEAVEMQNICFQLLQKM
tara:strand:- start:278 stop:1570 length:1293 start_codon:yes stop_codon:yes gene_type:complete